MRMPRDHLEECRERSNGGCGGGGGGGVNVGDDVRHVEEDVGCGGCGGS